MTGTILGIGLAMVAALRLLGRRAWCRCGSRSLWSSAVTSGCNSQHAIDVYSLTHLSHGVVLYWLISAANSVGSTSILIPKTLGEQLALVGFLEALWEVVENTSFVIERYRKKTLSRGYYGDSIANSVGDWLCCLVGAASVSLVGFWPGLVAVVALEVGLAVAIRDNLVINVVQLVWPQEWIRKWQEGK